MKPVSHHITNLALFCALSAFATSAALAASAVSDFAATDTNGDGVVTLEEFQAAGGSEAAFAQKDADGDRVLSREEFSHAAGESETK
jgi:hypothetical protein